MNNNDGQHRRGPLKLQVRTIGPYNCGFESLEVHNCVQIPPERDYLSTSSYEIIHIPPITQCSHDSFCSTATLRPFIRVPAKWPTYDEPGDQPTAVTSDASCLAFEPRARATATDGMSLSSKATGGQF